MTVTMRRLPGPLSWRFLCLPWFLETQEGLSLHPLEDSQLLTRVPGAPGRWWLGVRNLVPLRWCEWEPEPSHLPFLESSSPCAQDASGGCKCCQEMI
jgi:hypothetical protein